MRLERRDISVNLGDEFCTIRRSGRSTITVARILGREINSVSKVESVYLDRLVHMPGEDFFQDETARWEVGGAVSSILQRATVDSSIKK